MSRPRPAPSTWPYRNHRTMEQVMKREALAKVGHEARRRKTLLERGEMS